MSFLNRFLGNGSKRRYPEVGMPAKATEREDDEGSDWLTDDGQSEENEFNKELSGWKEMERDDTDVERALSRVMHVRASSARENANVRLNMP